MSLNSRTIIPRAAYSAVRPAVLNTHHRVDDFDIEWKYLLPQQDTTLTPLISMDNVFASLGVRLRAKLEAYNPTGSIKYRAARYMIEQAFLRGDINDGSHVIESSSGNMGAALAYVCAERNLKFTCVIDPRTQANNVQLIQRWGGELNAVDHPVEGCYLKARLMRIAQLQRDDPCAFWTNQYANHDNRLAHTLDTAPELHYQLGQYSADIICIATSSTGTLNGIQDFFRVVAPNTKIFAVDASNSVLFGNKCGTRLISGLGAGVRTQLSHNCRPDKVLWVSDIDAIKGCYLAREREGIELGGSSGAIIQAIANHPHIFANKNVVAIMPDGGEKYQATVYNDEWLSTTFNKSGGQMTNEGHSCDL